MTMTNSSSPTPRKTRGTPLLRVVRDAALIVVATSTVALTVNALRSDGIKLIAEAEYEILVPCPEPTGEAESIPVDDPRITSDRSLLIDAREPVDFASWRLPNAINVPFDWLAEQHEIDVQARDVAKRVARSGKQHVIVYGDGGDPDSGHHWAALLSAAGIKRVVYVGGGAPALRPPETSKEDPGEQ
jgi:rhodanese-related sulfurtransferase